MAEGIFHAMMSNLFSSGAFLLFYSNGYPKQDELADGIATSCPSAPNLDGNDSANDQGSNSKRNVSRLIVPR